MQDVGGERAAETTAPSSMVEAVREILRSALQLGARADDLEPESRLFGAVPELDSMAVVTVLTLLEEEFGITVHDAEISVDTFRTLGSLSAYVAGKVRV